MTTDNLCFYLQNRPIQTSQTGGQWYSDTSLFSIPCSVEGLCLKNMHVVNAGCHKTIMLLGANSEGCMMPHPQIYF